MKQPPKKLELNDLSREELLFLCREQCLFNQRDLWAAKWRVASDELLRFSDKKPESADEWRRFLAKWERLEKRASSLWAILEELDK